VTAPVGTARYWITLVIVVSRLAAGPLMRAKLLLLGLAMPLRDKLIGPRDVRLRLRYRGLELPWVIGPRSDLEVLNEVLVLEVHDVALGSPPATILDLGAHIGSSVLFWRARFPHARIVAVEPDPGTFSRLRRNVGEMAGVELCQVAVTDRDGGVTFFPVRQSWRSTLFGNGTSTTVQGRTLGSLVAELRKVDLLKVDIEGAERDILDDAALGSVGAIVGEFHDFGLAGEHERFFEALSRHFVLDVAAPSAFTTFRGWRMHEPDTR
jgi:FkbM family methyltransferase